MKINYLAESIIPSRSANSIHVMQMCSALTDLGHQVTLVVPKFSHNQMEQDVENIYEFYGVPETFKIQFISKPSISGGVYIRAIKAALFAKKHKGIIYSRDYWGSLFASFLGLTVYHEFHQPLLKYKGWRGFLSKRFHKSSKLKKIVVISEALKIIFMASGIAKERILVAHDAATEDLHNAEKLADGFHIGYVGHLYEGRGIEMIFEMAKQLPNFYFHLIGGNETDIKRHKENHPPKNLIFHGFLAPAKVEALRKSMDILLAPYQKEVKIWGGLKNTVDYMSPLKIFEYMSAKKPIIVSDLPVLHEVLTIENAFFCDAENANEWVNAIQTLQQDSDKRNLIASNAYQDFKQKYTWHQRAKVILLKI